MRLVQKRKSGLCALIPCQCLYIKLVIFNLERPTSLLTAIGPLHPRRREGKAAGAVEDK